MDILKRIVTIFKSKKNAHSDTINNDIKVLEKNIEELNIKKETNSENVAILLVNQNKSKEKIKMLEKKLQEWDSKVNNYIKNGDKNLAAEALKQYRELQIKFNASKEIHEKMVNDTEKLKTRLSEITLIIEQNEYKLNILKARSEQIDIEKQLYNIDSNFKFKDFNNSYSHIDDKLNSQEILLSAQKEIDESISNKLDDELFNVSISEELEQREQKIKK